MITELERLHQLFTQGALSEAEFTAAKASLLQGPSADLLKLDELRDELSRLQRDWDEERRKYNPHGGEPISWVSRFFLCIAVLIGCFFIVFLILAISSIIKKGDWGFLPICIAPFGLSISLVYGAKWQARLYKRFLFARQTYETRRAELEGQIAELRNQIRCEANGS